MKFSQIVLLLQVLLMGSGNSEEFVPVFNDTCPSKCGDVGIPFPFGIEEGCYLDKSYYIQCDPTTQIPLLFDSYYVFDLFPPHYQLEVLEIKLDGTLRVTLPIAYFLHNNKGRVLHGEMIVVDASRFPFSSTQNMLTAVGCDVEAWLNAQPKTMKCHTNCTQQLDLINGTCQGSGCCQVSIPESVQYAVVAAIAMEYNTQDDDKHGYAFIVENGKYTFNTVDLNTTSFNASFPVVLDWSVGNTTCEEARNGNGMYLCQENSVCYNGEGGLSGYRCNCSDGYSGNPYITNGCQDVDECESAEHNDCWPGHCENTPGSYICVCPKGQQGNAKEGGECTPVPQKQKSEGRSTIEGISEGILGAALAMILVYWGAKKRLKFKGRKDFFKQNGGIMLQKMLFMSNDPVNNTKIFTEEELKKATDNFNEANVIGQGGYGTVYKGILENKTVVAIKKSKTIDQSQIKQFVNEVIILSRINHPNIVKLLGCCLETQVPFIVYEYITNDTLCHHIHTHATLTFKKRLKIAIETAEALAYMHSTTQIIHRDIKPSNILLNDEFTAKISDFGISRLVPLGQTHLSTSVIGTIGYVDPEYFRTSKLTEKSDVYSFGVVLMELLTGKKIHSLEIPLTVHKGAAAFLNSLLERDALLLVLDDRIKEDEYAEVVKCVAKIAIDCLNLEGITRPTMQEVKKELEQVKSVFFSVEAEII